jgi:hypothetical protein
LVENALFDAAYPTARGARFMQERLCLRHPLLAAGPNMPFYTPFSSASSSRDNAAAVDLTLTGLDPDSSMFGAAQQAAFVAGLQPQGLRLLEGVPSRCRLVVGALMLL